jgi:hypothetical protein
MNGNVESITKFAYCYTFGFHPKIELPVYRTSILNKSGGIDIRQSLAWKIGEDLTHFESSLR